MVKSSAWGYCEVMAYGLPFLVTFLQLSPVLTSEVHSVRAGRHLATKLNVLVQQHFDLASTTITNIPMKVGSSESSSLLFDYLLDIPYSL